jgi:serine/threonine protein kinase
MEARMEARVTAARPARKMRQAVGNVGGTLDLRRQIKRCAECGQRFSHDAMFCPFDGTKLTLGAWDPSADPLLKKVIDGRYEVVGVLGEGGMGTVYDVLHTSLHRHFAMKVLRSDIAREGDLAARFTNEARATASIKHPNIVAITDFGRMPDGVPYFVMELLIGRTLSQAIKAGGPLPLERGIRIILQIAAALGAAHRARVVHRDLKPENVFLIGRPEAASDDVRVVDFGAAMILGASRVTKTGIVFGTPHYMSPEQASGQYVDHRADIYALGVMMYEMFTGKVPFEADTYMGVLTQHMFVQPLPPSQVCAAARELGALEEVVLKALEKKPEHRYDTMEQLAEEIERVVTFTHGGVKIAATLGRSRPPSSMPAVRLANELELPTTEEISASLTATSVHRRRARAQRWALYGAITLGVAAGGIGAMRLLRPRGPSPTDAATVSAVSISPPLAETTIPTVPSAASSTPAASAPSAAASSPPAPPAPPSLQPTAQPTAASATAPKKSARPAPKRGTAPGIGSDFVDPWAK